MIHELSVLATRAGWSVQAPTASYAPTQGGWQARVVAFREAGRSAPSFFVTVTDPAGVARHTDQATTVTAAMELAERRVAGRS